MVLTYLGLIIVGKVVNQRHNTDLEHKGEYLHMAQVLAIENSIPSAHCSDTPLMEATGGGWPGSHQKLV